MEKYKNYNKLDHNQPIRPIQVLLGITTLVSDYLNDFYNKILTFI